jgi:Xaa-Pro aminopeptidase
VVGQTPQGDAALLGIADDLYKAGLEQMRPGQMIDVVAQAPIRVVRDTRWEPDFFPGGFGHGIGIDLFAAPGGLSTGTKVVLQPGMRFASEPMMAVEGIGTGAVDDSVAITETGYQLLTGAG